MSEISPQLLSRLLRQHGPALVLYARQWCRVPEDVVQEAFVRLVEQERMPDNPVGWLYRVVRNGALNAARASDRRNRHESEAAGRFKPWFEQSDDQLLDGRDATEALQQLPDTLREIVIARLWGGLSFDDIAELSGVSAATTFRRYRAGLEALRERLGIPCREDQTKVKR
jgi:RNA polymerase sigma factor (sigma-70 family)